MTYALIIYYAASAFVLHTYTGPTALEIVCSWGIVIITVMIVLSVYHVRGYRHEDESQVY